MTAPEPAFTHRYEAVENLVHEAARWLYARRQRMTHEDPKGDLQADERHAQRDLEDAIDEVAQHGINAHPDDLHVDATAAAMKQRLAEKRAGGYRGWNDPTVCSIEKLTALLRGSLSKGKALDVANFAMMLHRREAAPEAITRAQQHADLQGLAERLLAPREIERDNDGWLTHPAMPVCDEGVRYDELLAAFGIETRFVDMESDVSAEEFDRLVESNDSAFPDWNPSPPEGEGWRLLEIFDTENGPYALFARKEVGNCKR